MSNMITTSILALLCFQTNFLKLIKAQVTNSPTSAPTDNLYYYDTEFIMSNFPTSDILDLFNNIDNFEGLIDNIFDGRSTSNAYNWTGYSKITEIYITANSNPNNRRLLSTNNLEVLYRINCYNVTICLFFNGISQNDTNTPNNIYDAIVEDVNNEYNSTDINATLVSVDDFVTDNDGDKFGVDNGGGNGGLSSGIIATIVILCFLCCLLILYFIFYLSSDEFKNRNAVDNDTKSGTETQLDNNNNNDDNNDNNNDNGNDNADSRDNSQDNDNEEKKETEDEDTDPKDTAGPPTNKDNTPPPSNTERENKVEEVDDDDNGIALDEMKENNDKDVGDIKLQNDNEDSFAMVVQGTVHDINDEDGNKSSEDIPDLSQSRKP